MSWVSAPGLSLCKRQSVATTHPSTDSIPASYVNSLASEPGTQAHRANTPAPWHGIPRVRGSSTQNKLSHRVPWPNGAPSVTTGTVVLLDFSPSACLSIVPFFAERDVPQMRVLGWTLCLCRLVPVADVSKPLCPTNPHPLSSPDALSIALLRHCSREPPRAGSGTSRAPPRSCCIEGAAPPGCFREEAWHRLGGSVCLFRCRGRAPIALCSAPLPFALRRMCLGSCGHREHARPGQPSGLFHMIPIPIH